MCRTVKCLICSIFLAIISIHIQWLLPLAAAQSRVDFKRDIEPIFAQSCFQCHGVKKAAGQLRLDNRSLAMKGGISGVIIVPGDPKSSRLMLRIMGEGGEARMPMAADPLAPEQIELIRKWIDQGAEWPSTEIDNAGNQNSPSHWAYIKPALPRVPQVKNIAWVRNPIDAFILARLEREGLTPSPEADKAILLRRVYLDLTGLPPSVKEVDAFLADNSPDAYEKVVDRLLASNHYGERWARPWLDLGRYADSNGYEKDNLRVMWKYRDWVINALNQDKPFDQFTIEQIAGDMLPNATEDQKIASGFNRNTMVNQEGGIDPEEARFETLIDRVNTTSTVWLGSTIACSQCHNHKYDPFTQKDFYRFMAFFDNAEYQIGYQTPGAEESRYILEPQISLPTPEQQAKRKAIDDELAQLIVKLNTQTPELDLEQAKWEKDLLAEQGKWTTLEPIKFESTGGATLKKLEDGSVLASGAKSEIDVYVITAKTNLKEITGLRLEAIPDQSLPKGGPGRDPYGNFLLTGLDVDASAITGGSTHPVGFTDVTVDDSAYRLEIKQFFGIEKGNNATDRPPGWFVNATGDTTRLPRQAVFLPSKPFGFDSGTTLTIKLKFQGGSLNQSIGRFRLSVTGADEPKRVAAIPAKLRPILSLPIEARTEKQKSDLSSQFRSVTPLLKSERDKAERLRNQLKALGIVTALIMQERNSFERPSTFFRERGSFLNKGDKVYASTPAVLPPIPDNAAINRLGLARWLVDENNPLTARVTVNRFWESIFGHGIVETSEDFGAQGERPWHPELLDWLAIRFMKGDSVNKTAPSSAWSIKSLIRLIVTSSTYRQTSVITPALQEKDPYNRLLARGPRFRMEAEMIRDVTLSASGLLSQKLGGPSVFPVQPDGIWKSPYSAEKWLVSAGEDRYRRSLYTFVRRSAPHPAMMTFDATSREYCTVRRVRTNTPLQALTMLNDEAAMESARALAKSMIERGGESMRSRLVYGFRACVSRAPNEKEYQRLEAFFRQQLEYFRQNEVEANKVLSSKLQSLDGRSAAELAAMTMVGNVLLNLDETLTKE